MNSSWFTTPSEDWFQVENFKPWIPFSTWGSLDLRGERNGHQLLDLFDSFALSPCTLRRAPCADHPVPCALKSNPVNPVKPVGSSFVHALCAVGRAPFIHTTFFVLGWLAERLPPLVREIAARGHEVASHGYHHLLPSRMTGKELQRDLSDSKKRLEDTIGGPVVGFRAPSFGIDHDILEAVSACGYRYDSSYNSFGLHGRYGKITLNGQPRAGIAYELNDCFFELPVSNLPLSCISTLGTLAHFRHFHLPWGGGAFFRLLPFGIFRRGVRSILDRDGAYMFYLHPWEIDPEQPRVGQASRAANFKHYTNLEKSLGRLRRMALRSVSEDDYKDV